MHELSLLTDPNVAPLFQSLPGQDPNYNLFFIFILYGLGFYAVAAMILFTKKQGDADLINDFDWFAAFAILSGTAAWATAAAIFVKISTWTDSPVLETIRLFLQIGAYLSLLEFALRMSFDRKEKLFSQFQIEVSRGYFQEGFSRSLKVIVMVACLAFGIWIFANTNSLSEIETALARPIGILAALGASLGFIRFALTLRQYFGTEEIVRYSWLMALAFFYYAILEGFIFRPIQGVPLQVYLLVFSFLAAHASFRLVRVLSIAPGRPVAPMPQKAEALEAPRKTAKARLPRKRK